MYYVYALLSKKNSDLYIGFSANVEKRFELHNKGKVKSTKPNRPWKLIYYEMYCSKKDATRREIELKKSFNKDELKKHLENSLKIE